MHENSFIILSGVLEMIIPWLFAGGLVALFVNFIRKL